MNANPVAVPVQVESGASGWEAIPLGARIGRVVALDEDAAPLVDFPGNAVPPIRALLALAVADATRLSESWRQARVLLVFANQDMRQPVITGVISESLPEACGPDLVVPQRLEMKAAEELILQCGDAKITLKSDGKVAIGGHEIDSRARHRHRIRGGTVSIN